MMSRLPGISVHRIVEHFGRQMVECALVCAADIHARAAPDWLKAFQHFDGGCIIDFGRTGACAPEEIVGHDPVIGGRESAAQAMFPIYSHFGTTKAQ
jgi:hypothetical protein